MRNKFTFWGALVAGSLLVLLGCQGPFEPYDATEADAGTGTLSLTIGRQGVGRTIMPEIELGDFVEFRLMFIAGPNNGNGNFSRIWTRNGNTCGLGTVSGTIGVHAGTWDLHVTAYLASSGNAAPRQAASGILEGIEIASGETVDGNVRLFPITQGTGTFSWDIDFPENVVRVELGITNISNTGASAVPAINFNVPDGETKWAGQTELPAGRYRVTFTLNNDRGETAAASEILHIYRNMESGFDAAFEDRQFIVPLVNIVLDAWDGSRWDFEGNGITAGHFYLLDIRGVHDDNFADVIDQFNDFSSPNTVPSDLDGLKVLVDAAIIGIAGTYADFLAGGSNHRPAVGNTIREFAVNNSPVSFDWPNNHGTYGYGFIVIVGIGVYEVGIVFDYAVHYTLAEQLARLRLDARSGGRYVIYLSGDEDITPARAELTFANRNNITVTIRGSVRSEIRLSETGSLFTVGSGITLILDNNITLVGRNIARVGVDNWHSLVSVNNGALIMNAGARITDNTSSHYSGGVLVNRYGTFTMYGGEISGNSGRGSGGGVRVSGTFTMYNGEISGNTADGFRGGGGVHVSGTFTMLGGEISGNTAGSDFGGGVDVRGGSTFTMHGGEISGNTGGGVGVRGMFTMHGGGISGNTTRDGGGVSVEWNGTFTMRGGEISGNTGGGVGVRGMFTMHGGEISGNNTANIGGVGVSGHGVFTMYGGEISGNTGSSDFGGGVFVSLNGTFTMRGGEISGNTANISGGGVDVRGTFTMYGGEISGNTAGNGGGVLVAGGTFTMHGGEISGNTNGGGVSVDRGTFTISNGVIYGNELALPENLRNIGFALFQRLGSVAHRINNAGSVVGTLSSTNNTIRVVNGQLVP